MAQYGSTKSTVMAIMKESTAGTMVAPGAGTDFVTLQPDIKLTPNFQTLNNAELRASIGMAKSIQGLESPQASFSHYLKHSNVEGQAPEITKILESVFGATSTNGTQRTTTTTSTVSVVKLAAGGSDFARGKAMLVKDPTNGYSIRPVDSVSTNNVTLGFNLAVAPLTGINVGKCVNYAPANSGHPTLSLHCYRANGQVYDAIVGALVADFSLNVTAGQLIDGSFQFQGVKYYYNPVTLTSANNKLDFYDGTTDFHVTVPVAVYRDPYELAQAVQDGMNATAAAQAGSYTVTYLDNTSGSQGKYTIATPTGTLTIKWNTGTNTANTIATKLGFSAGADSSGATSYTSATAYDPTAPYTPSYDNADPMAAKNMEVMVGDATNYLTFAAKTVAFQLQNTVTDVGSIAAASGIDQKLVTGRTAKMTVQAVLDKGDASKFFKYRSNATTKAAFNFGVRSGGNWVAGQCGCLYFPSAVISKFEMIDLDTFVAVSFEVSAFVDSSGNGEVYLSFL